MEGEELYYQTRLGTRFQAEDCDHESVGLADFRKPEEDAIRNFIREVRGGVLVMGGVAGTGKTHLLLRLALDNAFDYLDLRLAKSFSVAEINDGIRDAEINRARGRIGRRVDEAGTSRVLLLDESGEPLSRSDLDLVDRTMGKLLELYDNIVLAGGGSSHTSQEQTDIMAESLPVDKFTVETHSFPFKTLNLRQTAELIELAPVFGNNNHLADTYGGFDREKQVIHPEVAKIAAEIFIRYFRLTREVMLPWMYIDEELKRDDVDVADYFKCGKFKSRFLREIMHAGSFGLGVIPLDCFDRAYFGSQSEALDLRYEELMKKFLEYHGRR